MDFQVVRRAFINSMHPGTVNLFCRDKALAAKSCFYLFSVGIYIFRIVAKSEGNIIRIPWRWADAAMPVECPMKKAGRGKTRENKNVFGWLQVS